MKPITYTSRRPGEWHDPGMWTPFGIPGRSNIVVMKHTVRVEGPVACLHLTLPERPPRPTRRARLVRWFGRNRDPLQRLAYATAALLGLGLAVWVEEMGVVG